MKASDRNKLTQALRGHTTSIAADLREQLREVGPAREKAKQLHLDEHVGEDFDVWTDLLSRRAAVLWVLKSVYVRVLEDRGLLHPGRLLDPESQSLFERLAPNLGETAFLKWIYRDLAQTYGGLPELFGQQPAEIVLPSNELSRSLIQFWRHVDVDTGAYWSFAEEKFEGELMGDLYQELDPVVKSRFALCQTPDFVREFILDRTLTPAIETFGADQVRLLDPACGSGHFLIDGLKRLVVATSAQHPDWPRAKTVADVLSRVVGIDLNDYACALARTRLIMTAAELAGVVNLADAGRFHPHVYWADGLEQIERDEKKPLQTSLFEQIEEKPRATLTRSDVREALKKVFENKFHAVVANPPYITEKDTARKDYHREKIGKESRYISAHRKYSLGSLFIERSFQLTYLGGYVGIITSNNFMKREFGKPLIENVLSKRDLMLFVDTSQAYIPFHGTPTVMLFARNQKPTTQVIRAVMSKRGENGTPEDPALGKVWSSIVVGWNQSGFENEYISVADIASSILSRHPWSLGGGGAAELRERIEFAGYGMISELIESIGFGAISGADEIFLQPYSFMARKGIENSRPLITGEVVRDWGSLANLQAYFPYSKPLLELVKPEGRELEFLWPFRTLLWDRPVFSGATYREAGRYWYEWHQFVKERFRTPLSITFAFVATHNHFVLDRGGKVFNRSAPVIKLPADATEEDHVALLGLLNSSTACFWMKQVFHNKHGSGDGNGMRESWMDRYEFDSTKLKNFPLVDTEKTLSYATLLDQLAKQRTETSLAHQISLTLNSDGCTSTILRKELKNWRDRDWQQFRQMVALQEELDWAAYSAYGIHHSRITSANQIEGIIPGERAFEILLWEDYIRNEPSAEDRFTDWFSLQGWETPNSNWASLLGERAILIRERMDAILSNPALALIETANFKRRWYKPDYEAEEKAVLLNWLADRVEAVVQVQTKAFTVEQIVVALQDDIKVNAVAEVLTGRRDFHLTQLISDIFDQDSVPHHRFHIYKPSGLIKREAWERTWEDQRREDAGETVTPDVPPAYGPGDFLKAEFYQLRGKLDVPKERFIAFTEVPGRSGAETLYGWAGWTPIQRLRILLAIDETLEDQGISMGDRVGVLDSAWRLLPDAIREDAGIATRLKAELQSLVGTTGPSNDLIDEWGRKFLPPTKRAPKTTTSKKRRSVDGEES